MMRQIIIIMIISFLKPIFSQAQDRLVMKNESILAEATADSLISKDEKKKAALIYITLIDKRTFSSFKTLLKACEFLLEIGEDKSAYRAMQILVNDLKYSNDEYVFSKKVFQTKALNKKWKEAFDKIKENKSIYFDDELFVQLNEVYKQDQKIRQQRYKYAQSKNQSAEDLKNINDRISVNDSLNLKIIENILNTQGWPSHAKVWEAGSAIFLVLQHAPLEKQMRYQSTLKSAAENGEISMQAYSMFEDRLNLRIGKTQKYGTQLIEDTVNKKVYLLPVSDIDSLDMFRAKVGLNPISDYVKNFGIKWSKDDYLKNLETVKELLIKRSKEE
ncbi:DUF6624 domain-containing protein [Sphingobacterium deserti]|uniref:Uncharacterized protein n=1 Tax=Sphingobacterium deserti TaxID=1229276 RepID=A0A0B8T6E9_9SPHI|nr:DUF6624 domain-containing protein [Sphingobacterium deserti]KGE12745.1 hypothetical protein DI53_3484 [Sphingobacterium deserti]